MLVFFGSIVYLQETGAAKVHIVEALVHGNIQITNRHLNEISLLDSDVPDADPIPLVAMAIGVLHSKSALGVGQVDDSAVC